MIIVINKIKGVILLNIITKEKSKLYKLDGFSLFGRKLKILDENIDDIEITKDDRLIIDEKIIF